ncbi:MAG: TMEM165/GDT1 family protein [Oligosphaeraceae bacterium]|nr:TMEM165/GDT1 family protein [Oligosphaeraceae bacterium]
MEIKATLITFAVVFLAELGDKTQLMAMALSSSKKGICPSVFLGSCLALICTSAIAVFAGGLLDRCIPRRYLLFGSGLLFIALGVFMLVNCAMKSGSPAA